MFIVHLEMNSAVMVWHAGSGGARFVLSISRLQASKAAVPDRQPLAVVLSVPASSTIDICLFGHAHAGGWCRACSARRPPASIIYANFHPTRFPVFASRAQAGGPEPAVPDDHLLDPATKADIQARARIVAEVRKYTFFLYTFF